MTKKGSKMCQKTIPKIGLKMGSKNNMKTWRIFSSKRSKKEPKKVVKKGQKMGSKK
jgi:hypothetical protein